MPGNDADLRFWTHEQMLDHVREGVAVRRRRRQSRWAAASAAIVVLVAVTLVGLAGRGPRSSTVTASIGPNTTRACSDNRDPACGPGYWFPDPGPNQPLTITITPQQVGGPSSRTFTFHVVFDDPDARIPRPECHTSWFGDGPPVPPPCEGTGDSCSFFYGPQAPPDKQPGHAEFDETHTFAAPGSYQVYFSGGSEGSGHQYCSPPNGPGEPYRSGASKTITVIVP